MRLLILDRINGDQRLYVKAKIMRLALGEDLGWFTNDIVEMLISMVFMSTDSTYFASFLMVSLFELSQTKYKNINSTGPV
jgi:4-alpha-glucanotransferase